MTARAEIFGKLFFGGNLSKNTTFGSGQNEVIQYVKAATFRHDTYPIGGAGMAKKMVLLWEEAASDHDRVK